jgi:hypothetical protein
MLWLISTLLDILWKDKIYRSLAKVVTLPSIEVVAVVGFFVVVVVGVGVVGVSVGVFVVVVVLVVGFVVVVVVVANAEKRLHGQFTIGVIVFMRQRLVSTNLTAVCE